MADSLTDLLIVTEIVPSKPTDRQISLSANLVLQGVPSDLHRVCMEIGVVLDGELGVQFLVSDKNVEVGHQHEAALRRTPLWEVGVKDVSQARFQMHSAGCWTKEGSTKFIKPCLALADYQAFLRVDHGQDGSK